MVNCSTEEKKYHLDEVKYRKSFALFYQLFTEVPTSLFDYSVSVVDNELVVTALTETTVRVAIVELIMSKIPTASVKMVKPPLNFRVYLPTEEAVSTEVDHCLGGMFGDVADY